VNRDTVVLIDANNFAFANYFSHPNLRSGKGFQTGALHGCLMGLLRLSEVFPKSPMIVIWDGAGKSWRKVEFEGYKAWRKRDEKVRREVYSQIEVLSGFLEDLKVPQISLANVEADDLVGILSREVGTVGMDFGRVVIRSSDTDFYQLLGGRVVVYRGPFQEARIVTAEDVRKEYGFGPGEWCRLRALAGDSSDSLEGLPRVGMVTAGRLLAAGVRVPVDLKKIPQIRVARFKTDGLSVQDWKKVNLNYRLSQIVTDPEDKRLPEEAGGKISEFLKKARKTGWRRKARDIDVWELGKRLGEYDLQDVKMRLDELVSLY
jgi:5'-3' exonuclease